MAWLWMSFVNDEMPTASKFAGVAIVEADDVVEGAQLAWHLGINPGGEVLAVPIPENLFLAVAPDQVNRLLGEKEARALAAKIDEIKQQTH